MRLATFIESNAEQIVSAAEDFCRTLQPAARHLDSEALRDDLPRILETIVNDLRTAQTPAESRQKSLGQAPLSKEGSETAAQAHALLRAKAGFGIAQMVSEYRALRYSVLRLWLTSGQVLEEDAFVDMERFNEAIDQAVAESVAHFTDEADRWRHIFLAVLGHDLRGPLNAVLLTAELLSRMTSDAPITAYTERLIRSGKRMQELLDSLLDYSRSSLGRGIAIYRSRVDLAAECEEELEVVRAALPGHQIDLVVSGPTEGEFDASRVRESLANLVFNAARYSTEGSAILVNLSGTQGNVVISVANQGATIPNEFLPSLFEPLRRGQSESLDEAAGRSNLGLGLFIVNEVAVAHGGRVEVASSAGNTVFTVTLVRTPREK
jgi:hypothetical protein